MKTEKALKLMVAFLMQKCRQNHGFSFVDVRSYLESDNDTAFRVMEYLLNRKLIVETNTGQYRMSISEEEIKRDPGLNEYFYHVIPPKEFESLAKVIKVDGLRLLCNRECLDNSKKSELIELLIKHNLIEKNGDKIKSRVDIDDIQEFERLIRFELENDKSEMILKYDGEFLQLKSEPSVFQLSTHNDDESEKVFDKIPLSVDQYEYQSQIQKVQDNYNEYNILSKIFEKLAIQQNQTTLEKKFDKENYDLEFVENVSKTNSPNRSDAQCNLGVCYENGIGVAKDSDEAIKWYRKAAAEKNHDKAAQYALGAICKSGTGAPNNNRAREEGYGDSRLSDGDRNVIYQIVAEKLNEVGRKLEGEIIANYRYLTRIIQKKTSSNTDNTIGYRKFWIEIGQMQEMFSAPQEMTPVETAMAFLSAKERFSLNNSAEIIKFYLSFLSGDSKAEAEIEQKDRIIPLQPAQSVASQIRTECGKIYKEIITLRFNLKL